MTREDLEDWLAKHHDPLALLVQTNIALPWLARDGRPWLTGVVLAGRADDALRVLPVPLDLDLASLRGEVYEALTRRVFYTWDAPATWAAVKVLAGIQPAILGDMVLASRMLRLPLPVTENPWEQAMEVLRVAPRLRDGLGNEGQLAAYELETQVAGWLTEMSVAGYQWGERRVHPLWTTLHESGSGRIVSRTPSLSNVRKPERAEFRADPYKRWVCVAWPYADLTMVALLSGDPALKAAVAAPNPYAVLAEMWETDEERAREVWQTIATHGPNKERVSQALNGDLTPWVPMLCAYAPRWVEWWQGLVQQVPTVTAWLGRRLHVVEPRKVHGAVVMESVATALKMLLAFLRHEAEFRAEAEMAGFATVIPLYDRVYYQLDVHVPVERHVEIVKRLGALTQVGGHFHVEVSMGPSWGDLHRVDTPFGQETADLTSPPSVPVRCPVCKRTAQDWPTLEAHLLDAHSWTGEEVEGLR